MAELNPSVKPTSDPNYLNYSQDVRPQRNIEPTGVQPTTIHPTGVQQADMSGAYAGKGIGELISGVGQELDLAGKEADTLVKKSIDDKIFLALNSERERYTDSLNALSQTPLEQAAKVGIYNAAKNAGTATADALARWGALGATGATGGANMPAPLINVLPDQLTTVADAFESGKVSPTFFYGRLNEIAKQFRSQYPGYIDYIDQRIKQVTGVDPANAKITALTTQLNQSIAKARAGQDKIDTFFQRKEVAQLPGAAQVYAGMKAGTISPQAGYQWYAGYENVNYQRAEYKWQLEKQEGDQKMQEMTADRAIKSIFTKTVGTEMNTLAITSGVDFNKLTQHVLDLSNGKATPLPAQDYVNMQQQMSAFAQSLRAKLSATAYQDGYSKILTPQKINDYIDGYVKPVEQMAAWIGNKDLGPAYLAMRYSQAIQHQDHADLVGSNSTVGNFVRMMQVMNAAGGQNIAPILFDNFLKNDQGGLTAIDTYKLNNVAKMGSQVSLNDTGVPTTQRDVIDDMISKGIGSPKAFDDLFNLVTKIPEMKDDQTKQNLAIAMFSKGVLDMKWQDNKGRDIRPAIMNRMTAPDIANEMWKMGQTKPEIWNMYKNWVSTNSLQMFQRDIKDLNTFQMQPGYKLSWNTDTYELSLVQQGRPLGPYGTLNQGAQGGYARNIVEKLKTINASSRALAGIAELDSDKNPDVEAQILGLLRLAGWNINPDHVENLPDAMIQAIKASRQKQEAATKERYAD
jgi:hypothetical protein